MNDAPENELFSAYLDGELTAAEQADVEQALAASPAARQLLDDLRALSANLQALPQHKLDEDLSEQVIRLAEREILTRAGQLSKPAAQGPSLPRSSLLRRLIESRALVWSGLAVAVAVMLMIMGPKDDPPAGNGGLALVTDETEPGETTPGTPDEGEEGETDFGPGPFIGSGEGDAAFGDQDKPGGGGLRGGKKDGRDALADDALVDGTIGEAVDKVKLYEEKGVLNGAIVTDGRMTARKPSSVSGPSKGSGRVALRTADAGGAGYHATLPQTALAANAPRGSILEGFADEAGTMVVYCDISLEAAQDEVFAGLLATNGIALTDVAAVAGNATLGKMGDVKPDYEHGRLPKKQNEKPATPQPEHRARGVEQIYAVAASREQIVGMLSALSASEDTVLSLSIDPDPDTPEQNNLKRYDRSPARRRSGQAETRRPARPAEEQSPMQFGGGAQAAAGELSSKALDGRRSDDDGGFEGVATGQAWRIDMTDAPSNVQRLLRRGDPGRGRAGADPQSGVRSQPQTGSAYGGRQTPHVGKAALGRVASESATEPAGKPDDKPADEPTRTREKLKDTPKGPVADPAPADDAAPTQPVGRDRPGDRPHGVSGYAPPSSAPAAGQPSPSAEPAIQLPGVAPPTPAPVEQEKLAESPPAEAAPDLPPDETPDETPDDAKKAGRPVAEEPGQGQKPVAPQTLRAGGRQLQVNGGTIGGIAGDDPDPTDPTGGWQQAEPPKPAQTVRPAESTQTPQSKSGKGDRAFGTLQRDKLELRQRFAQQEVANYRTLFVVRIVDTAGRYSSRGNSSVEAAEPAAAAAEPAADAEQ